MGDDVITFYHAAPSRGSVVHWMLEEVGAPFRFELLDLGKNQQKDPAYLALNPMGKVPAIVHRGVVVTEVAAICCYLADAFPAAGLAPAIAEPERGTYLRWMFFGPDCLEPAMMDRMLKREPGLPRALGYGDFDTTMNVVARAVTPGPYLLGERFSAADVVIGAGLRWGMAFGGVPERPEFTTYTARLAERPALKRAEAKDAELAASLAG
ncbi:MAG TPA: glutathione S-transferase family protein [Geminicoccaceae bacterium]|nr:glutathione S-transferase family protein [Geminicoccaceae bacterium]